tara:strand:- start:3297 stop:3959 length:663 start_codon:yes stop_codon:yes gene_type:complete
MKFHFLLATALFVSSLSFSQVTFGPLAGTNLSLKSLRFSYTIFDVEYESTSGLGLQLGAFIKYNLADMSGIKAEVQVQSRCSSFNVSHFTYDNTLNTTIKDTYFGIPIFVDLGLTDDLSIEVGPSIGFLIGSRNTSEHTINGVTEGLTITGDDAIEGRKRFELGASFGAHYMLNYDIGIVLRYSRALNDMNENTNLLIGETVNSNYNLIQLNVTYNPRYW